MRQEARDRRIIGLVGTMANLYRFLQDANALEKINSYRQTVERLVHQTAECAYFIAEYSKTEVFGTHSSVLKAGDLIRKFFAFLVQRALNNLVSNADTMIAAYEASFAELKIEFIMGCTVQTALTTVCILEKVETIGKSTLSESVASTC